jgi:hypothetical protein
VPGAVADVCGELLELFGGVSDGRSGQGRDHPVRAVLALAAAAVVAGMKGYTAIAGWVADGCRSFQVRLLRGACHGLVVMSLVFVVEVVGPVVG